MRKKFNTILILLLIVILPVGSYLYLKSGFTFRKQALEELKSKGDYIDYLKTDQYAPSKGNTLLLVKIKELDNKLFENLAKIKSQFQSRKDFKIIVLENGKRNEVERDFNQFLKGPNSLLLQNAPDQILNGNLFAESNRTAMLIDTASQIRNYYVLENEMQFKKLVEHIAVVIPRKEEKDIVLQREKEK